LLNYFEAKKVTAGHTMRPENGRVSIWKWGLLVPGFLDQLSDFGMLPDRLDKHDGLVVKDHQFRRMQFLASFDQNV